MGFVITWVTKPVRTNHHADPRLPVVHHPDLPRQHRTTGPLLRPHLPPSRPPRQPPRRLLPPPLATPRPRGRQVQAGATNSNGHAHAARDPTSPPYGHIGRRFHRPASRQCRPRESSKAGSNKTKTCAG